MHSKWTLKHNKHHCIIVNQGGKNIGYQPNAGVQIMEADGYGFKDLNGSGRLDAFEDWRLPLKARVEDFSQRFGLSQQGDAICSDGKMVGMPDEVVRGLRDNVLVERAIAEAPETDREFLQENRLLAALILMLDEGNSDYAIQVMIASARAGLLNSVMYNCGQRLLAVQSLFARMRLFITILPDARMIRALRACVRDLEAQGAQGSIVPDANLHMTLAFIGDAERPDQVRAVLQKIPLPKIRLTLSKTGYFGDLLWAGIKTDPSLHAYVRRRCAKRWQKPISPLTKSPLSRTSP